MACTERHARLVRWTWPSAIVAAGLAWGTSACVAQAPTNTGTATTTRAPAPGPVGPTYRPTSTLQDIMAGIIDPSADAIWEAVEITSTRQGKVERVPKTDEDWQGLRARAITVLEASNLLVMPGRRVAAEGRATGDAAVDLQPPLIEELIRREPEKWASFSTGLHDAAAQTLRAVEAKDVQALLLAGEVLDQACENCHRVFWYPERARP